MYRHYFEAFPDLDKKNTPIFEALYKTEFEMFQEVEDAIDAIRESRDVDKAFGYTLDLMGLNVGLLRPAGMTDDEYRPFIKIKIIANRSGGDIETLNQVGEFIFGDYFLGVEETWREEQLKDIAGLLVQIVPSGLAEPEIMSLAKAGGVKMYFDYILKSPKPEARFGSIVQTGQEVTIYPKPEKLPENYKIAKDIDFVKLGSGKFKYVGKSGYVWLPNNIHGEDFTLEDMFRDSDVKGVGGKASIKGSAKNVFRDFKGEELELMYLDTSNVTDLSFAFWGSNVKNIDLSKNNTVNVDSMRAMFWGSQATNINVVGINTEKVTDMFGMYYRTLVDVIDLSTVDTRNVTETTMMFDGTKATKGYARTQKDADVFNKSSGKPSTLNFEVKKEV